MGERSASNLFNLVVEVSRRALNVERPRLVRGGPESRENKPAVALVFGATFLRRHVELRPGNSSNLLDNALVVVLRENGLDGGRWRRGGSAPQKGAAQRPPSRRPPRKKIGPDLLDTIIFFFSYYFFFPPSKGCFSQKRERAQLIRGTSSPRSNSHGLGSSGKRDKYSCELDCATDVPIGCILNRLPKVPKGRGVLQLSALPTCYGTQHSGVQYSAHSAYHPEPFRSRG